MLVFSAKHVNMSSQITYNRLRMDISSFHFPLKEWQKKEIPEKKTHTTER
jgi:hypothetical protein